MKRYSDHSVMTVTTWTVACQAPLSTEFYRQESWGGLSCPSPGDLPDPGIEPRSPTLRADSLLFWTTWEAHKWNTDPKWNFKCLFLLFCFFFWSLFWIIMMPDYSLWKINSSWPVENLNFGLLSCGGRYPPLFFCMWVFLCVHATTLVVDSLDLNCEDSH